MSMCICIYLCVSFCLCMYYGLLLCSPSVRPWQINNNNNNNNKYGPHPLYTTSSENAQLGLYSRSLLRLLRRSCLEGTKDSISHKKGSFRLEATQKNRHILYDRTIHISSIMVLADITPPYQSSKCTPKKHNFFLVTIHLLEYAVQLWQQITHSLTH